MSPYPDPSGQEPQPRSAPELILVTRSGIGVQMTPQGLASTTGAPVTDLEEVLASEGAQLEAMFTTEGPVSEAAPSMDEPKDSDFGLFYHVTAPEERLEALAERLRQCESVDSAYVKPPAEPARVEVLDPALTPPEPSVTAPAATPNLTARQDYLYTAPVGIEASYAWTQPGGRGTGVQVIDCEWGWELGHEDLQQNSLGLAFGTNHASTNHGTAVWGVIGGDANSFGVVGIAPDARLGAASFTSSPTSVAIKAAADALVAGDIILLEVHRSGPHATGQGQKGYIAVEWWPDDFMAIRYAVNKGIIVVEAAGNGWEDLDHAVYNQPPAGFPSWWKNPFNVSNPTSNAVLVGAGSPPAGTHGRTTSPWGLPYVDRARCGFSNWGARVDAQGWGWEVTTCGYGDLQGGADKRRWYTDRFSGTSSASPVVTGALASVQGVLRAKNMPLMTSARARQLLRSTGSPQQAAPNRPVSQRIGNRPNLRQLIPLALKQWVNNATIRHSYALHSSQSAWSFIEGVGWRRVMTGSADGISNVFRLCCEAQAAGTTVNAFIDDRYLYRVVAL